MTTPRRGACTCAPSSAVPSRHRTRRRLAPPTAALCPSVGRWGKHLAALRMRASNMLKKIKVVDGRIHEREFIVGMRTLIPEDVATTDELGDLFNLLDVVSLIKRNLLDVG